MNFIECDHCRLKLGSHLLCNGCHHNQEHIEKCEALLRESKRDHYHCADSWYCCSKCVSEEHGPLTTWRDKYNQAVCTCGAEEWNAKVDEVLNGQH